MSEKTVFCGLDLSLTGTGVAIVDGEKLWHEEIKTGPHDFKNSMERVLHIANHIVATMKEKKPELICIEDYFTGKNLGVIIQLCELGTMVRYRLMQEGFTYITATPTQVKKFCHGKGAGGKELVLKGVYKKWGIDVSSNNIADACVLAHVCRAIYNMKNGLPQSLAAYEKEVVDKVLKERQFMCM